MFCVSLSVCVHVCERVDCAMCFRIVLRSLVECVAKSCDQGKEKHFDPGHEKLRCSFAAYSTT